MITPTEKLMLALNEVYNPGIGTLLEANGFTRKAVMEGWKTFMARIESLTDEQYQAIEAFYRSDEFMTASVKVGEAFDKIVASLRAKSSGDPAQQAEGFHDDDGVLNVIRVVLKGVSTTFFSLLATLNIVLRGGYLIFAALFITFGSLFAMISGAVLTLEVINSIFNLIQSVSVISTASVTAFILIMIERLTTQQSHAQRRFIGLIDKFGVKKVFKKAVKDAAEKNNLIHDALDDRFGTGGR